MPTKGQPETLNPEMFAIWQAINTEGAKPVKLALLTFNKPDIKVFDVEDLIYETYDEAQVDFNPNNYVSQSTMDLTVDGSLVKRAAAYAVGYQRPKPGPNQPPSPSGQTVATIPTNVLHTAFVQIHAWMQDYSADLVAMILS